MGKRQFAGAATTPVPLDTIPERTLEAGSDKKTSSEVKGSGRTIFHWLKIIVDVIDDELQVSDAHKCAGKKVDNGKRVVRVATNVVSKASVAQAKLGRAACITNVFRAGGCPGGL